MKGNMWIFAPLCLLFCCMMPVDSMTLRFKFTLRDANQDIPLSMVEDSVDDMYFGCNEAMRKLVKDKYLKKELRVKSFADVWEACGRRKVKHKKDKALTNYHIQAICAYTDDRLYEMFNEAVRKEGRTYSSSFQFHSLHFQLTSAIQILNSNSDCHTTYRRTKHTFTGKVNQRIRFGSFASTSYRQDLKRFGSQTCFKVKTCSGAPLKNYSVYPKEEEVLIPPYEVFKITNIGQDKKGLEDCKVVYVLESAGAMSNLNCKVVSPREYSASSPTSGNNRSADFKPSNSLVTVELIR